MAYRGSGRSITMACYAGKLLQQPGNEEPHLVVVTDRNDWTGSCSPPSAQPATCRTTPVQADRAR